LFDGMPQKLQVKSSFPHSALHEIDIYI